MVAHARVAARGALEQCRRVRGAPAARDEREIAVRRRGLVVAERVRDDGDPREAGVRAVERARPEGAVGAEPQREAVAEEVLPLAADAERELERRLVRADALRGPERARLGLAVGRQAREVAVHGRGPVRAPGRGHLPVAGRRDGVEGRREGQLVASPRRRCHHPQIKKKHAHCVSKASKKSTWSNYRASVGKT